VTTTKNEQRDVEQARRDRALDIQRARVAAVVARSGDAAADSLDALLRANPNDRELLLAALERPLVSPGLIDSSARSPDLGIALKAVQNPSASAVTLEWVYRSHPNRNYFLQAIAAHPHSPPDVLRAIRRLRPAPISGLDIWFAGNASAPEDVLLDVARTSESIEAVRVLLRNPALGCATVRSAERGPARRLNPNDAEVEALLASLRDSLCR
jgi:hypothetical protein